ncbi:glutaminase [Hyphobacterium sp. CCMP332]|uniref:glutaminase n=1 Tax=Hyphobacterium sp. CCMP332 TaxID=2749086 RepID=UPI00164F00C5|nr:glutaminase [Hyphobacterium sp. CCMP332]QNL19936.1 glutaminase [Hyphobacterium sp. CCMP332]
MSRPLPDFDTLLDDIAAEARKSIGRGKVADYIPALARISPDKFGMAICGVDGSEYVTGDADERFSIQSISKVFTLILALQTIGSNALWRRVGREPSGTAFNSLVQLESEQGLPRNPFINAGAIVVTDAITAHSVSPVLQLLSLVRRFSGKEQIYIDDVVARSEAEHGHRNAAIAHLLKSQGNLKARVEDVLVTYYRQCAIAMTCRDLARAFVPLANGGKQWESGEKLMTPLRVKRINSLLLTCGLYDGVGNFAFRVGIPAKSGVGGGIVAIIPGKFSICVWSPELDELGNSLAGTRALELFARKTKLSIF